MKYKLLLSAFLFQLTLNAQNYSLSFDGSNDYVNADNLTGELNSPSGLPFTVQVWAYPETDFSGTTTNCTSEREAVFAFNKTGGSDENRNMLYYAPDGSSQKFWHHGTGNNNGNTTKYANAAPR